MSLFGGPLSTRAVCTNTALLEHIRQKEEEAAAREAAKRAKSAVAVVQRTKAATPPPDPVEIKKKKLKEDLSLFDDLDSDAPPKPGAANAAKPKARSTSPAAPAAGKSTGPQSVAGKPAGAQSSQQALRKHGVPLKSVGPSPPPKANGVATGSWKTGVKPGDKGAVSKPASSGPGRPGPSMNGSAQGAVGGKLAPPPPKLGQQAPSHAPRGTVPSALGASAGRGGAPAGRGALAPPPPSLKQQSMAGRGGIPGARPGLQNSARRRYPYDDDDEYDDDFVVPDDDEPDWRVAIRKMTGYNPNKFRDADLDDRSMEAGWRDIEAEEKRSLRMARVEDQREEELERQRMLAKQKSKQAPGPAAKKARVA